MNPLIQALIKRFLSANPATNNPTYGGGFNKGPGGASLPSFPTMPGVGRTMPGLPGLQRPSGGPSPAVGAPSTPAAPLSPNPVAAAAPGGLPPMPTSATMSTNPAAAMANMPPPPSGSMPPSPMAPPIAPVAPPPVAPGVGPGNVAGGGLPPKPLTPPQADAAQAAAPLPSKALSMPNPLTVKAPIPQVDTVPGLDQSASGVMDNNTDPDPIEAQPLNAAPLNGGADLMGPVPGLAPNMATSSPPASHDSGGDLVSLIKKLLHKGQ